jgi:VWFA-related protein
MSARAGLALLLAVVGASIAAQAAPAQQSQPSQPPTFRAGVEYVEVDARVVDSRNEPVQGLAQRDFQIFEDGVRQDIATFAPVNLPMPLSTADGRSTMRTPANDNVRPDVASNARQRVEGRIYLIALDDLFIDPVRVTGVRRFLAEFIDRSIGPDDLAAVVSLAQGGTFQNFTNDKMLLKSAVEHLSGGKAPSLMLQTETFDLARRAGLVTGRGDRTPADSGPPAGPVKLAETVNARTTQMSLIRLIRALSGVEGRSRSIIFVSEGTPFEMVTNTEGLSLINDLQSTSDLARRSNVPIYPVDPRALTALHEDTILVPIIDLADDPAASLQKELSESQRKLRGLADDTGGYAVVGVNDLSAGLDRIVRQSSSYYVLGYYSKNPKHDGKFRKIDVKVDRRDAKVLARHGYMAQPAKEPKAASLPGPSGSPEPVRAALNAVLPVAGMSLTTTAATFRESRAIYAEVYDNQWDRPHDVETTVIVTNERGEPVFRAVETRTSRQIADSMGLIHVSVGVPLVNMRPGHYTLAVDARQAVNRAISAGRAVPFQVVATGK